jgi:2'-5' RNA ligase
MATTLAELGNAEWAATPKGLPPGALMRPLGAVRGLPPGALLRPIKQGTEIREQRSGKDKTPKTLTHPAGTVTGIDEETGLPIVRRNAKIREQGTGLKEQNDNASNSGQRPMVQGNEDPKEIQASAKEQEPVLTAMAEAVAAEVPGAQVEGLRVKSAASQKTKEERGKPAATNIDNLGARLSANSRKALERLKAHIEAKLPVESKSKITSNSLNMDQYAIRTGGKGAANQVSELQVGTKDQVEALKKTEPLYEKQKKAEARGDTAEASRLGMEITAIHRNQFKKAADARKSETKPAAGETRYKFGNTQANIPDDSDAAAALNEFRDKIPNEHLAGDGKDVGSGGNHVTVRYGIRGDDTDGIRKYIEVQKPFTARLGKTDVFPPTPNSKGAAVVHAQVISPELERMNEEIQKRGDFEPPSFDNYTPHATIAYIDPDRAEEYKGRGELEGAEFPVDTISINDRNGSQTAVKMKGGSDAIQKPGAGGVLQHAPQGTREAGGGRGGVERSQQWNGPAEKSREQGTSKSPIQSSGGEEKQVKPGDVVRLKDGRAGVVKYFNPTNGQPARARIRGADNKIIQNVRPEEMTPVTVAPVDPESGWYGCDLDGTLAEYHGFEGLDKIGAPVGVDSPDSALNTVKRWIAEGRDVRILSARISHDPKGEAKAAIEAWTEQYLGKALPVTEKKDAKMITLLDDRAVQVEENTGRIVGGAKALQAAGDAHRQGEKDR